jgi:hypothetical protein
VKKILWNRYKQPNKIKTNTALFYLTTNMRKLPIETINSIIKETGYERYIIITNDVSLYDSINNEKVKIIKGPVKNIFEMFDTYIYTPTSQKTDCSPRFIVECAVFQKSVEYFINYEDPGIIARKKHIERDLKSLHLNKDDQFFKYMENFNEPRSV